MTTIIFLIIVTTGYREAGIVVHEMPSLQMCESVGKSIAGMTRFSVKWNCIEGVR